MGLISLGLSHKTAPVGLREKLSIGSDRLAQTLGHLQRLKTVQEAVVLSTCNRTEVYARPQEKQVHTLKELHQFFRELYTAPALKKALYEFKGREAVQHLFRVTSGLDSMVLGETEILGQVKNAYQLAQAHGTTGKVTNVLFQRALFVGKQVRVQTEISEGSSSVGSVAVQLATKIFGSLADHRVMVLGAGEMAEITVRHLLSQKISDVVVLNRTGKKAEELAQRWGGQAAKMDSLESELLKADIVICSTSAQQPLITADQVQQIMEARQNRSLYFVDIAVPRNVDPAVHDIDNVYVYNIDDLKSLLDESVKRREAAIQEAESLINTRSDEFSQWLDDVIEGRTPALKHQVSQAKLG